MVNRMKETRKHSDEEVARVMDTLAIAIRNKPATSTISSSSSSSSSAVDAKKEETEQTSTTITTSDG